MKNHEDGQPQKHQFDEPAGGIASGETEKTDMPPKPGAPAKPKRPPGAFRRKKPSATSETEALAEPRAPSEADAAAAFEAAVEEGQKEDGLKKPTRKPSFPSIKRLLRPGGPEQPRAPHRPGPPSWWIAALKFIRIYTKSDTVSGLALRLFVITAVTALLLSVGHAFTGDRIEERETEARDAAMRQVIDADEFLPTGDKNIYVARLGGSTAGYAVLAAPNGYGGPIQLIIGISPDFKLIGVSLLSMSETVGYGARMQTEPEFLAQFAGHSLPLNYGENGLDALSGATYTSDAVLNGVRDAIKYAIDYVTGGNGS